MHVLSVPTSSAASERSWSIHGFIQSQRRNRLTSERLDKLVFVYSNMGDKGAVDQILYELYPEAEDFIEDRDGEVTSLDEPDQEPEPAEHEPQRLFSPAADSFIISTA